MKQIWAAALLVLIAALAVPVSALSAPVTISYGRSWPRSIVVDPTRALVYVDATSGIYPPTGFSFGVINATSHSVMGVLPLKVTPGDLAFDSGRDNVYVAGSDSVAVYSGGAGTFVGNLSLGRPILHIAFDARASKDLYVTSGSDVYEVDPETGSVVASASVGGSAGGLALDPNNGRLYVADYVGHAIAVLQSSGLNLVGRIVLPSCCPTQLALDASGQKLYAVTGTNYLAVVDVGADTFAKSIAVAPTGANSTAAVAIDAGTGRVFVSFSDGGLIAELSPDGVLLGYLQVPSAPAGMAVDASTGELYVANYHQVTAFDARNGGLGPDYTWAALAAAGAAAAAVALVLVLRSSAWKSRSEPASADPPPEGQGEILTRRAVALPPWTC